MILMKVRLWCTLAQCSSATLNGTEPLFNFINHICVNRRFHVNMADVRKFFSGENKLQDDQNELLLTNVKNSTH